MTDSQTLIQQLRERGYRITPQRMMIIEAVAENGRHTTAEEIFASVHQQTSAVNIATIYRTLDFLVKEGLLYRTDLGNNHVIYATGQHGSHIHLICRQCGQRIEADTTFLLPLHERLCHEYGFAPDINHLSLIGLCQACRA